VKMKTKETKGDGFCITCSETGSICIKFAERRGFSRIKRKDKKATTRLPALLQNLHFEQGKTRSKTSPFRNFDAESGIFPAWMHGWKDKIPRFLPLATTSIELC